MHIAIDQKGGFAFNLDAFGIPDLLTKEIHSINVGPITYRLDRPIWVHGDLLPSCRGNRRTSHSRSAGSDLFGLLRYSEGSESGTDSGRRDSRHDLRNGVELCDWPRGRSVSVDHAFQRDPSGKCAGMVRTVRYVDS